MYCDVCSVIGLEILGFVSNKLKVRAMRREKSQIAGMENLNSA
jgi:hypothetical protein